PAAKGLFRGAMIQSTAGPGTNGSYMPRANAEQAGATALGRAGATGIADGRKLTATAANGAGRGLVADGRIIPTTPTPPPIVNDVPIIIGYTLNDLFVSRPRATAESWKA